MCIFVKQWNDSVSYLVNMYSICQSRCSQNVPAKRKKGVSSIGFVFCFKTYLPRAELIPTFFYFRSCHSLSTTLASSHKLRLHTSRTRSSCIWIYRHFNFYTYSSLLEHHSSSYHHSSMKHFICKQISFPVDTVPGRTRKFTQ